MRLTPEDPKELGRYLALANVGLELVLPVGVGLVIDHYLRWEPWGAVGGVVIGLTVGLAHLVMMANKQNEKDNRQDGEPRA